MLAAASGEIAESNASVEPKRTVNVETTLSLAINPVISAVEIRQSPKPSGAKIGAIKPEITAKMLSSEDETMCKWISNDCINQITMVATKITVNAL